MAIKPNPAWRGDPTFLPDVFRAFGVKFREDKNWKLWGMGDFTIIQGVFWHHTGGRDTTAQFIRYNPGLGNALSSQLHVAPDGLHTIVGAGIAYHAGRGSGCGYPTNNANPYSIGIEIQGNGTDPWPKDQLQQVRLATAAILWFLGKRADKNTGTMISHWEYSLRAQGKWDPGRGDGVSGHMMDMDEQRRLVNQIIDEANKYGPPAERKATPQKAATGGELTTKFFKDFITGYFAPQFKTLHDIWTQLRGPEGKGWPQLGKNAKGKNLTLVDAVAAIRQDLARIETKLNEQEA